MSLVGTWIACTVSVWLYVPSLKTDVVHTGRVNCMVVDDVFMKVGSVGTMRSPMIVDCRHDIMWLNPRYTDGYFLFMKEGVSCEH